MFNKGSCPKGLSSYCKQCMNAYKKKYREENKDEIRVKNNDYRRSRDDHFRLVKRKWYAQNREHVLEYVKNRRLKYLEESRKYDKVKREKHKDKTNAKKRIKGKYNAENLTDEYIKTVLKTNFNYHGFDIKRSEIPESLIRSKRMELKLLRKSKQY